MTWTLAIGAVTGATGDGDHVIQGLHDLIPFEIVTTHEKVATGGTTEQLGMVDATLLDI